MCSLLLSSWLFDYWSSLSGCQMLWILPCCKLIILYCYKSSRALLLGNGLILLDLALWVVSWICSSVQSRAICSPLVRQDLSKNSTQSLVNYRLLHSAWWKEALFLALSECWVLLSSLRWFSHIYFLKSVLLNTQKGSSVDFQASLTAQLSPPWYSTLSISSALVSPDS